MKSSSSTGSFCLLEGSREEACPMKRGELCLRQQYRTIIPSEHVQSVF